MTTVRITLMLTRGEQLLFGQGPAEDGAEAPLTVPSTTLAADESLASAATRVAATLGFEGIEGLVVQHVLLAATTASDVTELRVALAARAPADVPPPEGHTFRAAPSSAVPVDELTATALEACRRGAVIVDLDGKTLPVGTFPSSSTPAPLASQAATSVDTKAAPTILNAGIWFGGALLWLSSVLLVLDSLRALQDGGGVLLWTLATGSALYFCTHAGQAFEAGKDAAIRALAVLGVGVGVLFVVALVTGILAPGGAEAYFFLGVVGVPTFFLAQRRARKSMPSLPAGTHRAVLAAELFAILASLVVYALQIH